MFPVLSILLPGLDGTAELFGSFVAAAQSTRTIRPQPLPCDAPRDYHQLADWVVERLPSVPVALIAESFSGPLAVLVANRCPRVAAVVLCASFIDPPLRPLFMPPAFLFSRPPPLALVRLLLTGGNRELAESVRHAIATVPSNVIAHRVASVLQISVRHELEALSQPLLCLRATRDRLVRARSTEAIRAVKPAAEFSDVEAPHLLLQSNPDSAWSFIEPFLERVERMR